MDFMCPSEADYCPYNIIGLCTWILVAFQGTSLEVTKFSVPEQH